jgi:quinol monooxygenase YgiN
MHARGRALKETMSDSAAFGALLQLTARDGERDELLRVLGNYLGTLETGEPGTSLITVAADPNDDNLVWMWEEFDDAEAVRGHFSHDFFRALQLELPDLLAEPVAVRPLAPVARHVGGSVSAE